MGVRSRIAAAVPVALLAALLPSLLLNPTPAYAADGVVGLFADNATPVHASWDDDSTVELGVRFHADSSGTVTGVRFYKGPGNRGVHTGSLWTADGKLLTTATFANETETGWQEVLFSTPVTVTPGSVYVASYRAPVGRYAVDLRGLADGIDRAPLHAPKGGAAYAVGGGFPATASDHNYWVDVLFKPGAFVESTAPAANARNVPTSVRPSVTFSTAIDPATLSLTLEGTDLVSGTRSYDAATRTATFTPGAVLAAGRQYTLAVTAKTTTGSVVTPMTWSFLTATPGSIATSSVFRADEEPQHASWPDGSAIELGLNFWSDVDGAVTGVRFYKGDSNKGPHTGSLWTVSGQRLATGEFIDESAAGWQTLTFGQPVAVKAGTTYVVSYYAPVGRYATGLDQFRQPLDRGHLHVPAQGAAYAYGGGFPASRSYHSYGVDVVFESGKVPSAPAPVDPPALSTVVNATGPTIVPATINKDTVWGPEGSPYIIGDRVDVYGSLTLLPGTVVKLSGGAYGQISVYNAFKSLGTPQRPVVFTSLKDDSVLGDTNGDGAATKPAAGDWRSIVLMSPQPKVLDYTTVKYGGWNRDGAVRPSNSTSAILITNSLFVSNGSSIQTSTFYARVGIYNNHFTGTDTGISTNVDVDFDIVGNTFDKSLSTAVGALNATGVSMRFNTFSSAVALGNINDEPLTRDEVDVRYNSFAGQVTDGGSPDTVDWSRNWFGYDANAALPACMDPNVAAAMVPPVALSSSSTGCPAGQRQVVGYQRRIHPALSASPQVLPEAVREANAPRIGPINTYTGMVTYVANDLSIDDAGKTLAATRTYRSDRLSGGDVGPGWTSTFTESLSSANGVATLTLANGSSLGFTTDPAAGYVPAPGVSAGYTNGPDGTTITANDRTGYQFSAAGELTGMTLGDSGHRIDVQRSDGRVNRVTGVSGRSLTYTRSGGRLDRVADQTGRGVDFSYGNGRLTTATGVDGHAETYEYDGGGRLTRVATAMGRTKLAIGYRNDGRVDWVERQGQGRSHITYDDAESRRVITHADGTVTTQEYDWAGRLVTERTGSFGIHVVYDGEGRVVSTVTGVPVVPMEGVTPPAGVVFFDVNGDPVTQVDPDGRVTGTTFNTDHQPLVTTQNDGSTVKRTYDKGRLAELQDPRGKRWRYEYNDRGQITRQIDPLDRDRRVAYKPNGDVESVTDETNATTQFEFDSLGRPTAVVDPLKRRTETEYTAWGQVSTVRQPRGGETVTAFNNDRQPVSLTDATGNVTRYEYDGDGRQSSIVDAAGGRTTVAYDSVGRIASVTDARGLVGRRTYTTEGQVATVTDPLGAVTKYAYDTAGRLTRITDPLGQTTQQKYSMAGNVVEEWYPDGAHWTYGYDALGRRSQVTNPRNYVWKSEYDPSGNLLRTTDPLTYTTSTGYDDAGRPISQTDQTGAVTTIAYDDVARTVTRRDSLGVLSTTHLDAAGQTLSTTDGSGVATSYGYDADGNLTRTTDPAGSQAAEYDLAGRVSATLDAVGRRTAATYDPLGRIRQRTFHDATTEKLDYDAVGNLIGRTDRIGKVWRYEYDTGSRLTARTDPLGHTTRHLYDLAGRRTLTIDPTGVIAGTGYDGAGRPAVEWDGTGAAWTKAYDGAGNITQTVDPAGVRWTYAYNSRDELVEAKWGARSSTYTYEYDKAGRRTLKAESNRVTYEYDARGRVKAAIDGVGRRTGYEYDGAGRMTKSTPPSGHSRGWTYDTAGRIKTATDALGNATTYDYSDAGELTSVRLPRGGYYSYTYDTAGRLRTEKNPLSQVTTFDYDGEGRPTATTYPSGRMVWSTYDDAGNQVTTTADGQTRAFQYDAANRMTLAFVAGAGAGAAPLTFQYDNRGMLTAASSADGTVAYEYDYAGRLSKLQPPSGPATTYSYRDLDGSLAKVRGVVSVEYVYTLPDRLYARTWSGPSDSGTDVYRHDAAGQVTSHREVGYSASTVTYHPDGQIASLTESNTTRTYVYDDAGRLTSETTKKATATAHSATYTWDADGNRTSTTANGKAAVTAEFDLADRLTSTSDGASYRYDDDGHLVSDGTRTYGYNGFGEQASANAAGESVSYQRDALGRISLRAVGSTTETFTYDGASHTPVGVRKSTEPATSLVRTPGGALIAMAQSGQPTLRASHNLHGDLVNLAEDQVTGFGRWGAQYNAFGEIISSSGTPPVPLGFQGMYTDGVTGQVDVGFRMYQPGTGRFDASDTLIGRLTDPVTFNRYLYAGADPVNRVDLDGHIFGAIWDWTVDKVERGAKLLGQGAKAVGTAFVDAGKAVGTAIVDGATAVGDAVEYVGGKVVSAGKAVGSFVKEHGKEILAGAASVVVGAATFIGCTAATGGVGVVGCAGLAGAAGGALYGAMTCPEGTSGWKCAGVGAVAGGVGGLTGGVMSAAGAGAFAIGLGSGLAGDAADQLLMTGTIDPARLATTGLTGGLLGTAGSRLAGKFTPGRATANAHRGEGAPDLDSRRPKPVPGTEPASVTPGGRADGQQVIAGHGEYYTADGHVAVPKKTYLHFYVEHDEKLLDVVGTKIERGARNVRPIQTYGPGDRVPNYIIKPPANLNIMSGSTTVKKPRLLSELLTDGTINGGICHLAVCREVVF